MAGLDVDLSYFSQYNRLNYPWAGPDTDLFYWLATSPLLTNDMTFSK